MSAARVLAEEVERIRHGLGTSSSSSQRWEKNECSCGCSENSAQLEKEHRPASSPASRSLSLSRRASIAVPTHILPLPRQQACPNMAEPVLVRGMKDEAKCGLKGSEETVPNSLVPSLDAYGDTTPQMVSWSRGGFRQKKSLVGVTVAVHSQFSGIFSSVAFFVLDVVSVKPPTAQRRSTTAQQGSGSATPAGRHSTACAEALRPRPTYFHYSAIINLIPSAEIWGYTCLVTNPFTHTPPFSHTIKHSIRPSKTHTPWPEQTTSTHFHCFSVTVWLTTRVRLTPPTTRWRAS